MITLLPIKMKDKINVQKDRILCDTYLEIHNTFLCLFYQKMFCFMANVELSLPIAQDSKTCVTSLGESLWNMASPIIGLLPFHECTRRVCLLLGFVQMVRSQRNIDSSDGIKH